MGGLAFFLLRSFVFFLVLFTFYLFFYLFFVFTKKEKNSNFPTVRAHQCVCVFFLIRGGGGIGRDY